MLFHGRRREDTAGAAVVSLMSHDHTHAHEVTSVNKAFIIGIVLNTLYIAAEFTIGYTQSSLSLMTDAGHNATDVFSLLLSLFAFRLLKVKATEVYTYGFKKASILISLFNAMLLVAAVVFIVYEGVTRIHRIIALPGLTISIVALTGVAVNTISALLLFRDKEHDINIKGAYLHLLADALVSLAVVIGGVLIYYTGLTWIDTALSFLIAAVILKSSWSLLQESLRLSLDGTPRQIDMKKIRELILQQPQIKDVHHIHIWAISSRQNAMTAHLILADGDLSGFNKIKGDLKHELEHLNIHHTTFEIETEAFGREC